MFNRLPEAGPAPDRTTQAHADKHSFLEWLSGSMLGSCPKPSTVRRIAPLPAIALALALAGTQPAGLWLLRHVGVVNLGTVRAHLNSRWRPSHCLQPQRQPPTGGAAASQRRNRSPPGTPRAPGNLCYAGAHHAAHGDPRADAHRNSCPNAHAGPSRHDDGNAHQATIPDPEAPLLHPSVYAHNHEIIAPILADGLFDQFKTSMGQDADYVNDGQIGVRLLNYMNKSIMTFERIDDPSPDLHVRITATYQYTNYMDPEVTYNVTANAVMKSIPLREFPRRTSFSDQDTPIPVSHT